MVSMWYIVCALYVSYRHQRGKLYNQNRKSAMEKRVSFNLRMTDSLKGQAAALAETHHQSLTGYIVTAIENRVKEDMESIQRMVINEDGSTTLIKR